ncbi:hypothetical protein LAZ67_5004294 [Cordylochernes scorpioides]|uniref:Mos1 transposase HTH domain-containing protein n=1 Tax=Cordylochernes scorpioides TaxID=51811 RepID=A0ABY6KHV8_9ARAC|nr:hypothetical protein LAZ67_5004294 [Cordylochernes scorpioides]
MAQGKFPLALFAKVLTLYKCGISIGKTLRFLHDEYFNTLPDSHFQEGILILEKRWTKCFEVKGDYNLYQILCENEIKCADAFRMFTVAYGEATLDRSNVYRWYKMFSEGREDVNVEGRAGRPSTLTTDDKINEVEKMILANRRITVREVSEDLNISISSCHSIFINDLGMRRVTAKFVPKLLNCD